MSCRGCCQLQHQSGSSYLPLLLLPQPQLQTHLHNNQQQQQLHKQQELVVAAALAVSLQQLLPALLLLRVWKVACRLLGFKGSPTSS